MRFPRDLVASSFVLAALACSPPPAGGPDAGASPVTPGTLSGRVVSVEVTSRTHVPGAVLTLTGTPFVAVADAGGLFAFTGLPAATFELRAASVVPALQGVFGDVVLSPEAGRAGLEVVVGPVGRVVGHVRVGLQPVKGAHVVLEPFFEAITNDSGEYTLDGVPAGTFELVAGVRSPDGWVFSRGRQAAVAQGQDTALDFELGEERVLVPAVVEGEVRVDGGVPATVRVRIGPGVLEANAQGAFTDRAQRLPPGVYTVRVEADGFVGVTLPRVVVGSDVFRLPVLWLVSDDAAACLAAGPSDADGDGVPDDGEPAVCRCRGTGTTDTDDDGVCDDADFDTDNDGFEDADDNCPSLASADLSDFDRDGEGDACDTDDDGDEVLDSLDNCPGFASIDTTDADDDGVGDACDDCVTGDTLHDPDGDAFCDTNDNCPDVSNPDQADTNGNTTGDACEGVAPERCTADLCPVYPSPFALDSLVSFSRVGTTSGMIALTRNRRVYRGRGSDWSRESLPIATSSTWTPSAASAPSPGAAFVVGNQGRLMTWGADGWTEHVVGTRAFTGVWGADGTHAWLWDGTGFLGFWDGSRVVDESLVPGSSAGKVEALGGRTPDDCWALTRTALWHRTGGTWSPAYTHLDAETRLEQLWVAPDGTPWVVVTASSSTASRPWRVMRYAGSVAGLVQVGETLQDGVVYRLDGTGTNDVWMLVTLDGGTWDAIYRWDGTRWTRPPGGNYRTANDEDLAGLAVVSATEAYAAGSMGAFFSWNGTRWTRQSGPGALDSEAVDGSAPDDVWLLEGGGQPWRFDGTSWTMTEAPPRWLRFLSAEGGETWAANKYLDVYQRSGNGWLSGGTLDPWESATDPCPGDRTEVTAFHVSAPGEVWVAAARPRSGECWARDAIVFHRSGGTWTLLDPGMPDGQRVTFIAGPPSNLWLGSFHVARFDAGAGSFVDHADPGLFWNAPTSAWADATTVWTAFANGSVARWDATNGWVAHDFGTSGLGATALAGDASGTVVGTGNAGTSLTLGPAGSTVERPVTVKGTFKRVWVAPTGSAWATGDGFVAQLQSDRWTLALAGAEYARTFEVSFDPSGGGVFAGLGGQLLTRTGGDFVRSAFPSRDTVRGLSRGSANDLWLTAGTDAWHFDGADWRRVAHPNGAAFGGIWAATAAPTALAYAGAELFELSSSAAVATPCAVVDPSANFLDLDGHRSGIAYAVSRVGEVCRWSGDTRAWTREDPAVPTGLACITGAGGDEAWAAGRDVIVHRTSSGWARVVPPQAASWSAFFPRDVKVSPTGVVWIVGFVSRSIGSSGSHVLRFADGTWTEPTVATTGDLMRVGLEGERPWVLDALGAILTTRE